MKKNKQVKLLKNYLLYIGTILLILGFIFFKNKFGMPLAIIGIILITIWKLSNKTSKIDKEINMEDVRKIIKCPNCGAQNIIKNSNSKCEYCDSFIE